MVFYTLQNLYKKDFAVKQNVRIKQLQKQNKLTEPIPLFPVYDEIPVDCDENQIDPHKQIPRFKTIKEAKECQKFFIKQLIQNLKTNAISLVEKEYPMCDEKTIIYYEDENNKLHKLSPLQMIEKKMEKIYEGRLLKTIFPSGKIDEQNIAYYDTLDIYNRIALAVQNTEYAIVRHSKGKDELLVYHHFDKAYEKWVNLDEIFVIPK